jgi:hypothetical protein
LPKSVNVHGKHGVRKLFPAVCFALFTHQQITLVSGYDFMRQRRYPASVHNKAAHIFLPVFLPLPPQEHLPGEAGGRLPVLTPPALRVMAFSAGLPPVGGMDRDKEEERSERRVGAIHARPRALRKAARNAVLNATLAFCRLFRHTLQ